MICQFGFARRDQFGAFLNARGLKGKAVEIGTHRGDFATALLSQWEGEILYGVDSYPPDYDPDDPAAQGDRSADQQFARDRLRSFGGRFQLIPQPSIEACEAFETASLDFVYVDGRHRFNDVAQDLSLWFPKLAKGGILAGHDIISTETSPWPKEIQPAVGGFAWRHDLDLYLVTEPDTFPWSYYLIKP